jgi:hypothetical protein
MTDKKISELTEITGANTAADDYFVIVDTSADETKKISRDELNNAIEQDALSNVTITGGTIDGTVIGGTTPAAGTFTTGTFTGDVSFGDNDKAIFGAGSDLRIYHDGFHSYIYDTGAGDLRIRGVNLQLQSDAGENYLSASNNGAVTLYHDNSAKLATTSTGVDVTGTVTADGLTIASGSNQITLDTGDQTTYGRLDVGHFSNGTFIGTYAGTNAAANVMRFGTSGTERMRIDSSGNLLAGTTSLSGFQVGIVSEVNAGGGVYSRQIIGHSNTTNSGEKYIDFLFNGSSIGSITQSGTTAVLFNTSSDQRLKENIADADDAGSKVDAIQVRQFDWKADGSHQDYGMIAQELQAVAPEAVSGDAGSEEMMGVDYSKLVPMLIKEIQSLRNRVSELEGN